MLIYLSFLTIIVKLIFFCNFEQRKRIIYIIIKNKTN